MGLVGAGLFALLVVRVRLPVLARGRSSRCVVGTLFGAVIELVVIRRLFNAPRVIVLVATIGVAQLALAIVTALPRDRPTSARSYPPPVDRTWSDVAGVRVTGAQLAVLVVVPLVALALGWFLNRTPLGAAVQGVGREPRPRPRCTASTRSSVSTAVWAIAGFLATLSMMLVAADNGGAAKDLAHARAEHAGPRARRGGDRRHGVVPAGDARRHRHRRRRRR